MRCDNCNVRVPPNRPVLVCCICLEVKHYKCNNLSKTEATDLISSGNLGYWTCRDCVTTLFPANIDALSNNTNCTTTNNTTINHMIYCTACTNPCSPSSHSICNWCDKPCHYKCMKGVLGCISCCNIIIPGFNYESYHLTNSLLTNNGQIAFAPYDHTSLSNQVGSSSEVDDEGARAVWSEIADQLNKCK